MTLRELLRRWIEDGDRSRAYLKRRRFANGLGALSDEAVPGARAAPLHREKPKTDERSETEQAGGRPAAPGITGG